MDLVKTLGQFVSKIRLFYYHVLRFKIVLPPQGLGDILVLALGFEEIKKNNPNLKIAFIVHKKHFEELCNIFSCNIDKVIFFSEFPSSLPDYVLNVTNIVYGQNSHFDRFERALLDAISVNKDLSSFVPPIIIQSKKISLLFENEYKINRTVLITPEATTSPNCMPDKYWENLADELKEKGYTPVFNSKNIYGSHKSIFLSLADTIRFANLAGNVVGLRSGLNDVLACFSSAYQVIIYPNTWKKGDMPYLNGFDADPNGRYMEDGSLKRLYKDKNIVEFIYDHSINPASYF